MSDLGKMIADRMKSKAASSGDGAENDGEEESSADDSEGQGSYDSVESDAADELAGLCGVAEGDVAAFKTALKQYVKACMSKTEADEPAVDEEG